MILLPFYLFNIKQETKITIAVLLIYFFYFLAPPIFLVQPTDQKVAENAPAVLDCIAAGNPTPTLFWMKEGDSSILLPGTHIKQLSVTPEGSLRIG